MNPWYLVWIIPLSFIFGFFAAALLANAHCADCHYNDNEQAKAVADAYEDGFNEGLSRITEVG